MSSFEFIFHRCGMVVNENMINPESSDKSCTVCDCDPTNPQTFDRMFASNYGVQSLIN